MRSITTLELQYAHRFYGFKGEAQYLHGHTGVLTIEVEDTINEGVNMVFPCNEIQKTAWDVLKNFDHALILREDDPLCTEATMEVAYVHPSSVCLDCGEEFEHDRFHMRCPACGSADTVLVAGREMDIVSMEIEDGT